MVMENRRDAATEHLLHLEGRRKLEVRGVSEVVSFDEGTVVLETLCGGLAIEGQDLHLHVLDTEQGVVALDGTVNSIGYYQNDAGDGKKRGFLGKLFR